MRRVFVVAGLIAIAGLMSGVQGDASAGLSDARRAQTHSDELANELMQKMLALEMETNAKKQPLFVERNKHLSSVEGFWLRAIENHPNNGNWIFGQDREILKYVTDIAVEEIDPDHHHFKIIVTLRGNPFISNEKIWRTVTGQDDETTGPVDWVGESKPQGLSFFSYFDSKAEPTLDTQTISDITHVLRYELYQNPFTFYDLPTLDELASQSYEGAEEDPQQEEQESAPEVPADDSQEPTNVDMAATSDEQ